MFQKFIFEKGKTCLFFKCPQYLPLGKNEDLTALAPGNAQIGITGFARTIYNATHNRNGNIFINSTKALFGFLC